MIARRDVTAAMLANRLRSSRFFAERSIYGRIFHLFVFGALLLTFQTGITACNNDTGTTAMNEYFDRASKIVQEHYDIYAQVASEVGVTSLSEGLTHLSQLRSRSEIDAEILKMQNTAIKMADLLNQTHTKWLNLAPPADALGFHQAINDMMTLRSDGWLIRYQQTSLYFRGGLVDQQQLQLANQKFAEADGRWIAALIESAQNGDTHMKQVKVP